MRNLIILFTMLVSGFVSAQDFDFSCSTLPYPNVSEDSVTFTDSGVEFVHTSVMVGEDSETEVVRYSYKLYINGRFGFSTRFSSNTGARWSLSDDIPGRDDGLYRIVMIHPDAPDDESNYIEIQR